MGCSLFLLYSLYPNRPLEIWVIRIQHWKALKERASAACKLLRDVWSTPLLAGQHEGNDAENG